MRTLLLCSVLATFATAATAGRADAKPADTGTVKGTIEFKGTPPAPKLLDRKADPFCAKTKKYDESIVVSKQGGLRDVFVKVEGGKLRTPAPTTPVIIDQVECVYTPRVVGVINGQPIRIRNSDKTLHNVHAYVEGSTEFNLAQPAGARPIERTIEDADVLEVKCDVHAWMKSWAVMVDHRYFAVSVADGSFEIADVPAGSYTLSAWHPTLGKRTATIEVQAGKTVEQKLVFEQR